MGSLRMGYFVDVAVSGGLLAGPTSSYYQKMTSLNHSGSSYPEICAKLYEITTR